MNDRRITDAELILAVDSHAETINAIADFIHAHPELAYAEHAAAGHLATALETAGFEVERGVAGMETAFRATLNGAHAGRSVGMVAIYDAVASVRPDGSSLPVHSCGHGPLSGGVVAAALALAGMRDRLAGRVVVYGCPADEIHSPGNLARRGGKALSVLAGLWDGIDVALYAHPEFLDTVSTASMWMRRESVTIPGTRTLKRGEVPRPLKALHALSKLVAELDPANLMVENVTLTGDVEEGTGLVFHADFLSFAKDEKHMNETSQAVRNAFPDGEWTAGAVTSGVRADDLVTDAVAQAFEAIGREFIRESPPLPFATDFGNISQRVPAALIGVGRKGGWLFHTDEGAAEFAGLAGQEVGLGIARVLALSTVRLTEPV